MNIFKSIAIVATAGILFASCKNNTEAPKETAKKVAEAPKAKKEIAAENLQTASFKVAGMTCAMGCAQTIQDELSALDGVQTATIDFDKKLGTVTFDKTVQNPEALTKVVQATGDGKTYTVSDLKS